MIGSAAAPRLFASLPVLSAMPFVALTTGNWLPVVVASVVVLFGVVRNQPLSTSPRRYVYACLTGSVLGIASVAFQSQAAGPIPPPVANAITGSLLLLAALFVLSAHVGYAWICSWGVVALSAFGESTLLTNVALLVFLVSFFFAAATLSHAFEAWPRTVPAVAAFVFLVGVMTFGFSLLANRVEGVLQGAVEGLFYDSKAPRASGIGDEILMGSLSSVTLSSEALLELSEPAGYLRVNVMDRFDGHRWFTSDLLETTRRIPDDASVQPGSKSEFELTFFSDLADRIPVPAGIDDIRDADAVFDGGWTVRGESKSIPLRVTWDGLGRLPAESASDPALVSVPENLLEDLERLTLDVVRGAETDRENAVAVATFFQDNFEYSLSTDLVGAKHPIIHFVEERRPAYCVYFASAMAAMLRTQQIPSRVVSGYLPSPPNPVTGRVTVRQRDAHAWVEVWLADEERFVAFDPTPGGSRDLEIGLSRDPGLFAGLRDAIVSQLRRTWARYRFDPSGQLRALLSSPLLWLLLVCSGGLLLRRLRAMRATERQGSAQAQVNPELQRLYQGYLRSLRRVGINPRPSETDGEMIERLRERGTPVMTSRAERFVEHYRRARFGSGPFDAGLIQMERDLDSAIRASGSTEPPT